MRQLTSLDAQFLALENARQSGHVGGLAILDPSTTPSGKLELADVQQLLAERLPLLPPMRWRLAEVPLGLDYPYWVDDPDFDLDFHVRELALPPPGTDEKLAEQVARIVARPLDRARPLWELYLIHGLEDGHVAMLTKIHHATDRRPLRARRSWACSSTSSRQGRELPEPAGRRNGEHPGELEMLARGLLGLPRYPLRMLRSLPDRAAEPRRDRRSATFPAPSTVAKVSERLRTTVRGQREGGELERSSCKPPRTSFNGRVSPHRRFVFGQLSLDEVKAVKNAHGCTVNDVVVSICAGAVRRWLIEHDELPADPLVAQIPVSVRSERAAGHLRQPDHADERAAVHQRSPTRSSGCSSTHEALGVDEAAPQGAAGRAAPGRQPLHPARRSSPAPPARRSALASSQRGRPTWNLVISNVPGPQFPLYCAGAELKANYPVSVITDGMGLNITVMSYCGKHGLRHRHRPRPDARRLAPDRVAARRARGAEAGLGDPLSLRENAGPGGSNRGPRRRPPTGSPRGCRGRRY